MTSVATFLAAILAVLLLANLVRILVGPTDEDRLIVAQLVGTFGASIALVLSIASKQRGLVDVALILAALGAITGMVYSYSSAKPEERDDG